MKLKNYELHDFILFLDKLTLSGKASRMRTRLKKLLVERFNQFEEERMEIANRYAVKDMNGEPVKEEVDGEILIKIADQESANKELIELVNEDCVIDETEERRDMLLSVKDSILNCDLKFTGKEADLFDRFCEIVEELKYE